MMSLLERPIRWAEKLAYPILTLVVIFLFSRAALWNVRPMTMDLGNMHFLPTDFLRHHLWHGLVHMHAQPPLFNLFLGLVLKVVPTPWLRIVFTGLYSLMALALCLAAYRLMQLLKISPGVRFWVTLSIMFFPSTIQAETWLYFSLPVSLLLLLCLLSLYRGLSTVPVVCVCYLITLSVVVLTRSAYHWVVWMLPLSTLAIGLSAQRYGASVAKRLAAWTVIVSLLPAAIYIRNLRLYGEFQSSTWLGFSAWSQTYYTFIDKPRLEQLITDGKVTPLARIPRFSPTEVYLSYYNEHGKTGIALLDAPHNTEGDINFNHFIFPRADLETYRNSVTIIKTYPRDFMKAVLSGAYTFFGFSPYRFLNTAHVWARPQTLYGKLMVFIVPPLFLLLYVVACWTFARESIRAWKGPIRDYGRIGALAFMLFTIAYMTAQTILLVFPEANYIRIPMDSMLWVGAAMALDLRRGA